LGFVPLLPPAGGSSSLVLILSFGAVSGCLISAAATWPGAVFGRRETTLQKPPFARRRLGLHFLLQLGNSGFLF